MTNHPRTISDAEQIAVVDHNVAQGATIIEVTTGDILGTAVKFQLGEQVARWPCGLAAAEHAKAIQASQAEPPQ